MSRKRTILAWLLAGLMPLGACDRGASEQVEPPEASSSQSSEAASRSGEPPGAAAEPATRERFDFDGDAVGSIPGGFTAVHSGRGEPGDWQIVEAPDAPSGRRAVAQLGADSTGNRFPLLVLDELAARDVELEVLGKPISGRKDQAIGLIWRFQDADNYYILRANALEDNVVLYKMEDGKRSDLDLKGRGRTYGLDIEVPFQAWSRLGVRVRGNLFTASLDGQELFQVEDDTFTDRGQVGLWTKADSVTWFDDFAVRVLDAPASSASESEPGE